MTRVLIVDDQPAFRHHLCRQQSAAGLAVIGEAEAITEAETQVRELQPDLAVVDAMLPDMTGLEATPRLKAPAPQMRVILVSAYRDRADVFRTSAQAAGAEAFVLKDDLDLEMVQRWKRPAPTRPAPARNTSSS